MLERKITHAWSIPAISALASCVLRFGRPLLPWTLLAFLSQWHIQSLLVNIVLKPLCLNIVFCFIKLVLNLGSFRDIDE